MAAGYERTAGAGAFGRPLHQLRMGLSSVALKAFSLKSLHWSDLP